MSDPSRRESLPTSSPDRPPLPVQSLTQQEEHKLESGWEEVDNSKVGEALKPRIGGIDTIYHQAPHEQPFSIEHKYHIWLKSSEQPWKRIFVVTEEWKSLDLGWMAGQKASLLVLFNDEGKFLQTIPTSQQREEADAKVVEMAVGSGDMDIMRFALATPQGPPIRITPYNTLGLWVKCQKGKAKCILTVFPE